MADAIRSKREYYERYCPSDCPVCEHPKSGHAIGKCCCIGTLYTGDNFYTWACDCKETYKPNE